MASKRAASKVSTCTNEYQSLVIQNFTNMYCCGQNSSYLVVQLSVFILWYQSNNGD